MTTSQSKQILTVATRALALLNPEWQVTAELRQMLESANSVQALTVKARRGKIRKDAAYYTYKPIVGAPAHIEPKGSVKRREINGTMRSYWTADIDQPNDCLCAGCQILNGFWKRNPQAPATMESVGDKFDKAAVISKLSLCACGGTADDHAKDELENLLKCSHCDTCEAFHYDVDEKEQEAA